MFASIRNENPMQRQFGDRKISRRTEGPEGDLESISDPPLYSISFM